MPANITPETFIMSIQDAIVWLSKRVVEDVDNHTTRDAEAIKRLTCMLDEPELVELIYILEAVLKPGFKNDFAKETEDLVNESAEDAWKAFK